MPQSAFKVGRQPGAKPIQRGGHHAFTFLIINRQCRHCLRSFCSAQEIDWQKVDAAFGRMPAVVAGNVIATAFRAPILTSRLTA